MYRIIRLTSRPLKRKTYNRNDIGKPKKQAKKQAKKPAVVLVEPVKNTDGKPQVLNEEYPKELAENDKQSVNEEVVEEVKEGKKKKRKSKKKKDKNNNEADNNEENTEKEKRFTIWEEIPEEPRSPSQLAAAEIINQDGYYNTIEPIDIKEEQVTSKGFNWKIPAILLGGILILAGLVYFNLR